MTKNKKIGIFIAFLVIILAVITIINKKPSRTPEEIKYINQIETERAAKDDWMKNDPASPFNKKGKVEFHPLKYFDVDPGFVFHSKLYENEKKDSIVTQGTKGDIRKGVRWGYVKIIYEGKEYKINVYQIIGVSDGQVHYTIWFTDKTTNDQTYGVGRYLDFERVEDDANHLYQIDFNLAYSPYCAYSPNYSCTVPLKEDYIDLAVKAGEKKFHD
jgi:uncharacterized protein (DUF1684 family)